MKKWWNAKKRRSPNSSKTRNTTDEPARKGTSGGGRPHPKGWTPNMNREDRLQATAVIAPPSISGQGRRGRGAASTPGSPGPRATITLDLLFDRLISFFSSLRLTVV